MNFLIALVFVPPALALFALALVFAAEVFAAFAQDPVRPVDDGERGDVAIVIPAHNEGAGVVATIENVRAQMTANDRLIVVADNCSDDTADQARAAGADVIERNDPARRGKGYALQFGVDHLRSHPPSLVVFLDADCRMAPDALDRIARRARAMNRPVQALYLMEPPQDADAKAVISAFAWLLINDVRMSGLQKLAGFSRLTGAGMAFPWTLISCTDLASGEIVEDLALTIKMIDAGAAPYLDKSALVTSVLAASEKGAATQRARWEHGSLAMARKMAPPLLARGLAGDRKALAMALDLAIPPLTVFAALIAAGVALSILPALFGVLAPMKLCLWAGVVFVASLVAAWAAYGRQVAPPSALSGVFDYLVSKLKVYGAEGRRSAKGWTRTDRGDGE